MFLSSRSYSMISFLQGLDDLKEVITIMERLEDIFDHDHKGPSKIKKGVSIRRPPSEVGGLGLTGL